MLLPISLSIHRKSSDSQQIEGKAEQTHDTENDTKILGICYQD